MRSDALQPGVQGAPPSLGLPRRRARTRLGRAQPARGRPRGRGPRARAARSPRQRTVVQPRKHGPVAVGTLAASRRARALDDLAEDALPQAEARFEFEDEAQS
jgi:hypothetical protein